MVIQTKQTNKKKTLHRLSDTLLIDLAGVSFVEVDIYAKHSG